MSRQRDDLEPDFRVEAFELLARCTEAGIPVRIVETLRTREQQEANIRNGVSWQRDMGHFEMPGEEA